MPVVTLGEVPKPVEPELTVCREGTIAAPFLVSLNARDFVCDPDILIGPGDCVTVLDSGVADCAAVGLSRRLPARRPLDGSVFSFRL